MSEQEKNIGTKNVTPQQISFLKRLNHLLIEKEKELLERFKVLSEVYDKKLIQNGGDLMDYTFSVDVTFFNGKEFITCCAHSLLNKTSLDLYIDITSDINKDWSQHLFPDLGERWSHMVFFLWLGLDSNNGWNIFKTTNINFDVSIRETRNINFTE